MSSLYNLTNDYLALQEMAQNAETAEDMQALEDTISSIADAIEVKGENYAKLIKCLDADNEGIKKEISRLQKAKKANENLVNRLKANMDESLKAVGSDKLKCGTFTFSYRKTKSVEILDLNALPSDYKAIEYKPDKNAIKKAINDGEAVAGAALVEKNTLQLR
uniref:Resistance protein n=1 Tax=Siphoviridae sp. ct3q24 TaxID=2827772 RepID=A0A8S5SED0_9CAUD|nr:MAG TPA: resistance protein [Siphoviridae sp. ct3q24]